MFQTEIKVNGEFVKGTIKRARNAQSIHVVYLNVEPLTKFLTANDIRTLALELQNVADKLDELKE